MKFDIITGIIFGLIVAFTMKYVPIFHGFDSNDVKRIIFTDEKGEYVLIPLQIDCK